MARTVIPPQPPPPPITCPACQHAFPPPAEPAPAAKPGDKRSVEELAYLTVISVHAVTWVLLAVFILTQAPGRWTFADFVILIASGIGTGWTHQRHLDARHIARAEAEYQVDRGAPVGRGPSPARDDQSEYEPPPDPWGQ